HCHTTKETLQVDKRARFKLVIASVLCLLFMSGEIVGGILAHSLAIVSDAAHLLTDFASFMISLMALYVAARQPTKKLSFGWYRAEILGALMSILFLWVLTGILFYLAVMRMVKDDYDINSTVMLITAACGVAFNIVMGLTLHQHGHKHSHGHSHDNHSHSSNHQAKTVTSGYGSINSESEPLIKNSSDGERDDNINVKAAFIHVVGDLIQSVGVLIAAFIIYFKPEWKAADPICTFVFSFIVMVTTFTIFRDIIQVLMEGTPRGIDITAVRQSFYKLPGVKDVHDLRLWSLSMDKIALSVHLAVEPNADPIRILKLSSAMVQYKYRVAETTIQVEEYVEEMMDCTHCKSPQS
ncbi:hypothetical protein FSP39_006264, partial [Pinctada imbricata]